MAKWEIESLDKEVCGGKQCLGGGHTTLSCWCCWHHVDWQSCHLYGWKIWLYVESMYTHSYISIKVMGCTVEPLYKRQHWEPVLIYSLIGRCPLRSISSRHSSAVEHNVAVFTELSTAVHWQER